MLIHANDKRPAFAAIPINIRELVFAWLDRDVLLFALVHESVNQ